MAWAQNGELLVAGDYFSTQTLHTGGIAFSNRTYTWEKVAPQIEGWQYTQVAGGVPAIITASSAQDNVIYIAATPDTIGLSGWKHEAASALVYNDHSHSSFDIYARHLNAGERLLIPESNWTGLLVLAPSLKKDPRPPLPEVPPGVIIDSSPDPATIYLGSPSIAILPNGDYVACHDLFGPGTTFNHTRVFGSSNKGAHWQLLSEIDGAFWSNLFVHRGALYMFGNTHENGSVFLRRSEDGGRNWTSPTDQNHGLLTVRSGYSSAPTPVIEHDGRLWRAMEVLTPGTRGRNFSAMMFSVSVDADLLQASNWTVSNIVDFPKSGPGLNWLEGNAVVAPDDSLVDVLRVERSGGETAAMVHISADGKTATFDAGSDFFPFPGGSVKFTIRYDSVSKRYWAIVNKQKNPDANRNLLALTSSADLKNWRVERVLLQHPDRNYHAFQYADWQFEGDDIIFVARTAFNGANSFHNANYLTFHRIENFRQSPQ